MKLEFPRNILEEFPEYQISWKSVRWKPSCSMRTDRHTEYDEADNRFLQLSERAWKSYVLSTAHLCVLYYCHTRYGHIQYYCFGVLHNRNGVCLPRGTKPNH